MPGETSTLHDSSAPALDRVDWLDDALRVSWKDGDAATFHFVWLRWAQVERGDFFSTLRVLEDRLGLGRDDRRMPRGAYS